MLGSGDTGDDVAAFAAAACTSAGRASGATWSIAWWRSTAATPSVWSTASPPTRCWPSASRPRLPVTRAEVEYAVREEMALTLEDFMERRSRLLLWEPDNGLSVAEGVARTMAAALGWDAARVHDEVSRYRALVERLKSFDGDSPEAEAAQAAHG